MPRKSDRTSLTLMFTKTELPVLDWIRIKAQEEDRSMSKFIIRVIKKCKEEDDSNKKINA